MLRGINKHSVLSNDPAVLDKMSISCGLSFASKSIRYCYACGKI